MTDFPEGRYALVMVTEQGDSRVITAFERVSDYMEYLEIQRMEMDIAEERMRDMFGLDVDKGELN